MEIVPLGPGFAAELRGVTLAEIAADTPAYEETRAAFEQHSVIVLRSPRLRRTGLRPSAHDHGRPRNKHPGRGPYDDPIYFWQQRVLGSEGTVVVSEIPDQTEDRCNARAYAVPIVPERLHASGGEVGKAVSDVGAI